MKIVNGREVMEDGEVVTRSMLMLDAKGNPIAPVMHKPGYATPIKDGGDHYKRYNDRLTSAYKNPPALAPAQQPNTARGEVVPTDTQEKKNALYGKYDARLREQWKGEQAAHARGERAANV